jgi:signal transduction histidine kinase
LRLADQLAAERERILEAWRRRAESDIPAHLCLLGPGISACLERIVEQMENRARDPRAGVPALASSTAEISVERSVMEVGLLRRIVLAVLEEAGPLRPDERETILDALDGCTAAIASHGGPHDEASLRAEEWLEVAVRAGGVGAWRWDGMRPSGPGRESFEITRNDRYNQILDVDPSLPWTSDMLFQIIHPDDVDMVEEKIQSLASGLSDVYEAVYRIRRRNGDLRWIQAEGRSVKDETGKVVRLTGAVRDITDRVKLQAERDQFVATLSHDMRNPLAAARANAELLLRFWPRVASQERLINKIVVNVDRVDRMIQDLLDASRMQAGHRLELAMSQGDLSTIMVEAVEALSAFYGDRFRPEADGDFRGAWPCDAFRRVVENLATNAAKYGDPTAPVSLRLSRGAGAVSLAVHNEGDPIPPEEQKRLFNPYYRGAASQSGGPKGWGLGLTLVRGIAEALGGGVELQSAPERGTTFRFSFPAP